jgi:hypothetical protein
MTTTIDNNNNRMSKEEEIKSKLVEAETDWNKALEAGNDVFALEIGKRVLLLRENLRDERPCQHQRQREDGSAQHQRALEAATAASKPRKLMLYSSYS